jgi:hypothetical protein
MKQTHLESQTLIELCFHFHDQRKQIAIWNWRTPSPGLRHGRSDLLRAKAHVEEEVPLHLLVSDLRLTTINVLLMAALLLQAVLLR